MVSDSSQPSATTVGEAKTDVMINGVLAAEHKVGTNSFRLVNSGGRVGRTDVVGTTTLLTTTSKVGSS